MRAQVRSFCVLLGLTALLSAGCLTPTSEHPLSDEQSSVVDKRLIGFWTPVEDAERQSDMEVFAIGRKAESTTAMEFVATRINGGEVVVGRFPLFLKGGKSHQYASVQNEDPQEGYSIFRYEHLDGQDAKHGADLAVYALNDKTVVKAIESNELAGQVERKDGKVHKIHITAEPDALLTFLEEKGDTAFGDGPLLLKRRGR